MMRKIVLIILFIGTALAISLIPPLKEFILEWGPWAFMGLIGFCIASTVGLILYFAYCIFFTDLREDHEKYDDEV